MLISVVVSTRNRAPQIGQFLDSAAALAPPVGADWELGLADNGSADGTAEVARRFADRLPLRIVREDRASLSNARNAGVQDATGEYICWTDVDVLLDPHWLAEYATAFASQPASRCSAALSGPGRSAKRPTGSLTRPLLGSLLAERPDKPDGPITTDHLERLPFGANFIVRRDEQNLEHDDADLGAFPDFRRLGEEIKVMIALLGRGYAAGWAPGAMVNHLIPECRQCLAYVARYFQDAAATSAFLRARGEEGFINAGPLEGRISKRRLARHAVLYRGWRLAGRPRRWIYHFIELNRLKGFRDAMQGV